MPGSRRNLLILALCQTLAMTSMTMVITAIALVGLRIAPSPKLATLPLALQLAVTMASAIPASLLMRRFGRRAGFSLGAAIGVVSSLTSAFAIQIGSFELFCASAAAFGVTQSFAGFYRFAAIETAAHDQKARAASLVLAGGVVAGLVGPMLAALSRGAVPESPFAGTFATIAPLTALAFLLIQWLRMPPLAPTESAASPVAVRALLRRPTLLLAVASASVGYASMSLLMTATPLAMAEHGHGFPATAFVIQWHVVAMYAPSFVAGALIQRLGVLNVILLGTAAILGSVAIDETGTALAQFWTALALLGVGWNFLYVGGTTLLAESHGPGERAKVQALNEFVMFALITAASLGSGLLQQTIGWSWVNLAVVPGIVAIAGASYWLRSRRHPQTA